MWTPDMESTVAAIRRLCAQQAPCDAVLACLRGSCDAAASSQMLGAQQQLLCDALALRCEDEQAPLAGGAERAAARDGGFWALLPKEYRQRLLKRVLVAAERAHEEVSEADERSVVGLFRSREDYLEREPLEDEAEILFVPSAAVLEGIAQSHGGRELEVGEFGESAAPAPIRDVEAGQCLDPLRVHSGRAEGNDAPPVVPDERGLLLAERGHQGDDVSDHLNHPIVLDRRRGRRPSVPAHVDGRGAITRLGQRRQLITPRVPRLRKAVHQNDQRTFALLGDVNAGAISRYRVMLDHA